MRYLGIMMAAWAASAQAAPLSYQDAIKPSTTRSWDTLAMEDSQGQMLKGEDLRGKVLLLNLFFTSCRSICSPMTAGLVKVRSKLSPAEREAIVFLSISIDPQTDTAAKLLEFQERYEIRDRNWIFSRAFEPQLLRDYFENIKPGQKLLDHQGRLYLIDPQGRYLLSYRATPQLDAARLKQDLSSAVRSFIKAKS